MTQPDPNPERRRVPRVDLMAELQGHLVALDEEVQVKQVSLGGMVIETTAPVSPRLVHDFRVVIGDKVVTLRARVIHSRVALQGDVVRYLSGVQYVDPSPEALTVIGELVRLLRPDPDTP